MDFLLQQAKEIWYIPLLFGFNIFMFFTVQDWSRWVCLIASIIAGLAMVVVGIAVVDNYTSGCYSAPKDVAFEQGMTLCPGQRAHGTIGFSQESQ